MTEKRKETNEEPWQGWRRKREGASGESKVM